MFTSMTKKRDVNINEMATRFSSGAVNQPCDMLCGAQFPPGSSMTQLSAGGNNSAVTSSSNKTSSATADTSIAKRPREKISGFFPARGRLGIEEIPFQGQEPFPTTNVPPPAGGWGAVTQRESNLRHFTNRSTQGVDGGARSANITRFTPQLIQWQQHDDMARVTMHTRNASSQVKRASPAYP